MAFNYVSIGKRVYYARKKRGLTQAELAEQSGKSTVFICQLENGEKCASLESFVTIANALNISADELLIDNLSNTIKVSNHAFADMLADCGEYEKRVLFDILSAAKSSIRNNRSYLPK
ncbi:MAG: helix-turn-helix transcriptional regulator [Clostridia bacterium]|nr:helix-turn-helix transcriptional regulator [Clostridia bacterium]